MSRYKIIMTADGTYQIKKRYALLWHVTVPIIFTRTVDALAWIETDKEIALNHYCEE
jgi:hypothetical protein